MTEATKYSDRLGAISREQFEAVAARWNLGRFLKAETTTSGLFGQNAFVTTSGGEFVLRGAPHWVKGPDDAEYRPEDRWQFAKEKYFAQQLHERTGVPVPWPMLHDETSDIFGWPYLVMPKMPGTCFNERDILNALDPVDRLGVAKALGQTVAEMQTLTSPFAGDFGTRTIALEPYPGGAMTWNAQEIQKFASTAEKNGSITGDDRAWIDDIIARALKSTCSRPNTYVHCDYKLNNLTVMKSNGVWRVTGLFDFHEARFADGGLDIVRTAYSYLDTEPQLTRVFTDSYFGGISRDPSLTELMPLFVVNDRMKFWEFFAKPDAKVSWLKGKTFRSWTEPYVDVILELL
jgi:aminoglycoside phosphotransferase (APT) family kinase protein